MFAPSRSQSSFRKHGVRLLATPSLQTDSWNFRLLKCQCFLLCCDKPLKLLWAAKAKKNSSATDWISGLICRGPYSWGEWASIASRPVGESSVFVCLDCSGITITMMFWKLHSARLVAGPLWQTYVFRRSLGCGRANGPGPTHRKPMQSCRPGSRHKTKGPGMGDSYASHEIRS